MIEAIFIGLVLVVVAVVLVSVLWVDNLCLKCYSAMRRDHSDWACDKCGQRMRQDAI